MPHLGQSVLASIFSVCTLCLSTVWTIESFCRKREGKSEGFVVVVIVLGGWSGQSAASVSQSHGQNLGLAIPGFSDPQQSHLRMFLSLPLEADKRLPQEVQKIRDPMAAILSLLFDSEMRQVLARES